MTKCAQLIQEQVDVDFVDINVGCPIDLIYKQVLVEGVLSNSTYKNKIKKIQTVQFTRQSEIY